MQRPALDARHREVQHEHQQHSRSPRGSRPSGKATPSLRRDRGESERVFRALTSEEITAWWVRPGVFDTREWSCDMRVGGRWRASGISRGQPYVQEGEFLEIDPPHKLIHTWDGAGRPDLPSTVTYLVERFEKEHGSPFGRQALFPA